MSGRRWRAAAWLVAAGLAAGVGACAWGIPLPVGDNIAFLLEVRDQSLLDILRERFLATNYLRPFQWAQLKVLLDLSQGHYFLTFRGLHVLQLVAIVFLFVAMVRVRTVEGFAAASIGLTVLLGVHTITRSVTEGPLTVLLACAVAVHLAFAARPSRWRDAAAVALLIYAAFYAEVGLLVWVVYAAAFLVGCRGLSPAGMTAATAFVALYFVLRFALLPIADESTAARATGVGFSMMEPAAAAETLGGRGNLYAHNVLAAASSLLFAEPREGVWHFLRRAQAGELAPWLWVNVVTSSLTTICLVWFAVERLGAWRRREFTHEDRLAFVFIAMLAAGAAMSFAYTRDAVMGPAGFFYALAACAALQTLIPRVPRLPWLLRPAAAALILAVSLGWTTRTIGLTYLIRDAAFETRNDWAMVVERLEASGHMPSDPAGRALVHAFRRDALQRSTPSPRLHQPWAEEYFDRLF